MEKNLIAKFEVNVPKTAKTLAKFAGKGHNRPMMNCICIEPGRGIMTATATHALQVVKIDAVGEWPDGLQVLADPKHIAKVAGKHVAIAVFEEVREAEETTIYGETEKVNFTFRIVEIECGGETYTDTVQGRFPDVMRVIPEREGRKSIRLTAESVEALKTICKLHKGSDYIAMDIAEGSDSITVYDEVKDYLCRRAAYDLKLAAPAELTTIICCNPTRLAICLNGSDGVISFHDDEPHNRPMMFDGEAEATILMPYYKFRYSESDTIDYIAETRTNIAPAQSLFAEDAAAVVAELQRHAVGLWQSIVEFYTMDGKCSLTPGNYSAKDIADRDKAKCGRYVFACEYGCDSPLTIQRGNINLTVSYGELFSVLAAWESAVKCKKSVFAVGSVEEVTDSVMTATEDGAVEEKKKLRKLGGNWYCDAKRTTKSCDTTIYYELNGVKFEARRMPWDEVDDAEWQPLADTAESRIAEALHKQADGGDAYYTEVVKRIEAAQRPATATVVQKTDAGGSIRAKVLQYKPDGNTLTEKTETLKKYADGVYYTEETELYGNIPTYRIIFEDNGVFWHPNITGRMQVLETPEAHAKVVELRENFAQNVLETAKCGGYIRMLEIEVMRRLGFDTAPLFASREACLKRREEEERQKAEEAALREQQRMEAEQRRKIGLLADGKEKLMAHKAVTVEQIELLAKAVGYTIHGRTLGFMREKVSEAVLNTDETVTVWGRKLTQRNIYGAADVIREIAERVKAQTEAEAQRTAIIAETARA